MSVQDQTVRLLDRSRDWADLNAGPITLALGRPMNWRRDRLLIYALGRQPSLGYSVNLVAGSARTEHQVLTLTLALHAPAPGDIVATAISRPCLVAAIPRAGWRRLELVDEQGQALGPPLPR